MRGFEIDWSKPATPPTSKPAYEYSSSQASIPSPAHPNSREACTSPVNPPAAQQMRGFEIDWSQPATPPAARLPYAYSSSPASTPSPARPIAHANCTSPVSPSAARQMRGFGINWDMPCLRHHLRTSRCTSTAVNPLRLALPTTLLQMLPTCDRMLHQPLRKYSCNRPRALNATA